MSGVIKYGGTSETKALPGSVCQGRSFLRQWRMLQFVYLFLFWQWTGAGADPAARFERGNKSLGVGQKRIFAQKKILFMPRLPPPSPCALVPPPPLYPRRPFVSARAGTPAGKMQQSSRWYPQCNRCIFTTGTIDNGLTITVGLQQH